MHNMLPTELSAVAKILFQFLELRQNIRRCTFDVHAATRICRMAMSSCAMGVANSTNGE